MILFNFLFVVSEVQQISKVCVQDQKIPHRGSGRREETKSFHCDQRITVE